MDAGVLTIYVPLCPGETIIGATIDEFDDDGEGVQAWTARSPRMATQKRVIIDAAAWQKAEGDFIYSGQEFSVEIDATAQRYGTSVLNPRRISATLPAGKYDVDGTELSSGDLDKLAECANSDANG